MKNITSSLYLSGQTVFTSDEIAILWQETNPKNLKGKINYYVNSGILKSLRRGIYALSGKPYDSLELATRIFIPSYVGLETVLAKEGVIFQHYDSIFVLTYQTRDLEVSGNKLAFRKVNSVILSNPLGIIVHPFYSIATKERAFLDLLYLSGQPYFDNLEPLDWDFCRQILPIYNNKALIARFETYVKH